MLAVTAERELAPVQLSGRRRAAVLWILAPAGALILLTAAFAHWTATSAWSFPRFLLAVPLLVYLPGKLLLDGSRVSVRPLEHLTVSLLLGMIATSAVYWLTMRLAAPALFPLWVLTAAGVCLYRSRHSWRDLTGWRPALDGSQRLLVGLIALAWTLLAISPLYYRNLVDLPDGGLALVPHAPDVAMHLAVANELTHTVPPQVPFVAGRRLAYHYAPDLLPALFHRYAGLSVLDLTVRFLPTLLLATTLLAIFCCARAWLGSGRGAILVTFLVMFGEDFSFLPGLLGVAADFWSADYFWSPTTFSLYWFNPMLPALALLFGGLFCLHRFWQHGGRGWLGLTALHFAAVTETKVFVAAQVLASLAVVGLYYLVRFRDTRPAKLLALTCLFALPLGLHLGGANAAGAGQTLVLRHTFIPATLRALDLDGTAWGHSVMRLLDGSPVTLAGPAALFLIALPGFLLGSLGLRVLALPALARHLLTPRPSSGPRFFLAVFIAAGVLLALTCAIVHKQAPLEGQYNNAVWFYVQSKYVMWIVVVEVLRGRPRTWRRPFRAVAVTMVIGLSLPSTVQFFYAQASSPLLQPQVLGPSERALLRFLDARCPPGTVVLAPQGVALPLTAFTRCRTPIVACPYAYSASFVPAAELARRDSDRKAFWECWAGGDLRTDVLTRYQVDYLLLQRRTAEGASLPDCWFAGPKRPVPGQVWLRPCFENDDFVGYQVCCDPPRP